MPYTTHGHWVGDEPPTEPGPELVARCGGPGLCPGCNQEAASAAFFAAAGHPQDAAEARTTESVEAPAAEAMIDGERSHADVSDMVRRALEERLRQAGGELYSWVYIADMTADQVVYQSSSKGGEQLWQCSYEVSGEEVVLGEPAQVARSYMKVDAAAGDGQSDDELGVPAGEAFAEELHPRAPAGAAAGGQFAAGGGASSAASKKAPAKKPADEMGYDAKTGKGTGYGKAGGDAKVKALQQALNAAGLTDAGGKKLVIDGKLGPKTTAAIKAAQRKLGLAPTGKAGADFLKALKASKSAGGKNTGRTGQASATAAKTPAKKAPAKTPAKAKAGMTAGLSGKEADERVDELVLAGGRVVEALDDDPETGARVFRVRIIAYGDSKNLRRYPRSVLESAAALYTGAKAYDHHRSEAELQTSTIAGLIGHYRNVEAEDDGLYGDLNLLPSATHAAESLDATLEAQTEGLPPLIGVSHDVYARYKPVTEGGRRLQEATEITRVNSADLVADPAAGGKAVRMVAADIDEPGTEPDNIEEDDVPPTKEDILGALADATEEELAAVGLSKAATGDGDGGGGEGGGDSGDGDQAAEATQSKTSFYGRLLIKTKVTDAGLPERVAESLTDALPERITEADVDAQIAALKSALGVAERAGLAPKASVQVTQEAHDKKTKALDNFFEGNFSEGYGSFRSAWADFTGQRLLSWDVDVNRMIMHESAPAYDSGFRSTEALDSASWAQVLGDSITRRLVAVYRLPGLQSWRRIVSSMPPINDFRTQRIGRVGGYGVLPDVAEGAPYQPLTSPGDEEATYAITKRGGTEELTLEMIANDDIRAIAGIPTKLGRAAAQTLFRFVWDMFRTNATCTYDATALFHTDHGNLDTSSPLSASTLSIGRRKMREQVAYGDSVEVLGFTPRLLVVPPELEEIAYKLTRSAVAVTSGEDATTPNIHQGLDYEVVDYFSDANDWFLTADPAACPTIEVGFYRGRQDPEMFSQTDPTQGAVFSADKILYKMRHAYSGTPLDHRGVYSGQG